MSSLTENSPAATWTEMGLGAKSFNPFALDIRGHGARRSHAALRDREPLPLSLPALMGCSFPDCDIPKTRISHRLRRRLRDSGASWSGAMAKQVVRHEGAGG